MVSPEQFDIYEEMIKDDDSEQHKKKVEEMIKEYLKDKGGKK